MGGHISGAHYNPAVSLALMMRGKITQSEMFSYWIAQLAGGLLGAALSCWLKGDTTVIEPGAEVDALKAIGAEIIDAALKRTCGGDA